MTTELNAKTFKDWLDEDEEAYISELSYGANETPWGVGECITETEFSHGDGHETGFVFEVGGKLFRISGTYSSWDSTEFDSIVEVEPVQVTVTRFKAVGQGTIFEEPSI